MGDPPPSASRSHELSAPLLSASSRRHTDRNVYSLSRSPERPRGISDGGDLADDTTRDALGDNIEVNGAAEDDYVPATGEDDNDALEALDDEPEPDFDAPVDPDLQDPPVRSSPTANRSRNTPRHDRATNEPEVNGVDASAVHASGGSRTSQKRSAPEETSPDEPPRKRPGRPRKDKTKTDAASQPPTTKSKGGRPKKAAQTQDRTRSPHEPYHNPGATRPMQRQRHETPADGEHIQRSRYGRVTFQPLEYWKGEHAVFKRHERAASIEEIVRMDDVTPMKRPSNAAKRKKKATVFEDEEVDPDDYVEEWENEDGVIVGPVRNWDSVIGNGGNEVNNAGE